MSIAVKEIIINKFNGYGNDIDIPLMNGGKTFKAMAIENGIVVSNLDKQPLLQWDVFYGTIELLSGKIDKKASKGDAMGCRLGDDGLLFDSVEGYIAEKVYGKAIGDSVFRRITPIAAVLSYCNIVINGRGFLELVE
ncbi:hypothetical protein [Clostridium gasigenes]|uniref:Uncharacterized protein n=1 Tax=Clostridium gasigenes TaxID=94869 RepID=A0A7X0VRN5_9CLOT|nr:hypothetical protein [Clostridium gasigenes]MBB6714795.1 hypothetical protein [Clostridium gasigenes]